jgi:hypothetical protein
VPGVVLTRWLRLPAFVLPLRLGLALRFGLALKRRFRVGLRGSGRRLFGGLRCLGLARRLGLTGTFVYSSIRGLA